MRIKFTIGLTLISICLLLLAAPDSLHELFVPVYSDNVYPLVQRFLVGLNAEPRWVVSDLLFILIPLAFFLRCFWILRANALFRIANLSAEFILWVGILFTLLMANWGYNYQRPSLYSELKQQGFSATLLDSEWDFARRESQNARSALPVDVDICSQVTRSWRPQRASAFVQSTLALSDGSFSPTTAVKGSFWSPIYTRLGVAGLFNPLSGEPTYNKNAFVMAQPFIQLHEYAHFAGYALEQDADIIAYWSGWLSPDPVWQYSAWLEFWMSVKAPSEVYQQLSNAIIDDMKCYQDFLTSQPRWSINTLAWKVYEVHLKSQGVTEGLGSYQLGEAMALTSYQNWLQPKSLR